MNLVRITGHFIFFYLMQKCWPQEENSLVMHLKQQNINIDMEQEKKNLSISEVSTWKRVSS